MSLSSDLITPSSSLRTFGPGAAQVEPAADVAHPPGDVVERVVFQALQVVLHQPGQGDVAPRAGLGPCSNSSIDFRPDSLFNKAW